MTEGSLQNGIKPLAQSPVFQPLRDTLKELPVHAIIADVVRDVLDAKVTIVAARTGSGKSMMLPSAQADATQEQVVVMVPRRFLATDAACNVAELSGTTLGEEVGFALGQVNGERSLHNPDTRLLFCTYGYALRSGLINTSRATVLDEVHEGDQHISLARAVLHQRKQQDPGLRILEMSATVNARAQAAHWDDIAETSIHFAEGSAHPCDLKHESPMQAGNNSRTIEEVVISVLEGEGDVRERIAVAQEDASAPVKDDFQRLLDEDEMAKKHKGSNGIAVFRGGVKEVENTVEQLERLLHARGISDVEVVGIHSGTPSDERRGARQAPKEGRRKIIVGTNVIESGVNLRWVDAGVSDGVRKVPHHREDSGADTLIAEDLPQSGILQQMGRINRAPKATGFERGIFILHAKNNFEQRRKQSGPAIERESMLAPAFHAASLGHDPTKLKWDVTHEYASEFPARLEQARQDLLRLELINHDWTLTREGEFITRLPVSPQAGAMLNEARRLDEQRLRNSQNPRVLRDAVIIAAISENKMLKVDSKRSHHADQLATSDLLDAMKAYQAICIKASELGIVPTVVEASNEAAIATANKDQLKELQQQRLNLQQICEGYNMTVNGFIQVAQLVEEMNSRLNKLPGISIVLPETEEKYDTARYDELKQCILNGRVNQLFQFEHGGVRDLLRDYGSRKRDNGLPCNGYEVAESSIVDSRSPHGTLVTGTLREVAAKRPRVARDDQRVPVKRNAPAANEPLLVLSNTTVIPPAVFIRWAKGRTERFQPIVSDAHVAPDGKLHANYAGKARFEVTVPHEARSDAGHVAVGSQAESLSAYDRKQSSKKAHKKGNAG
jgi:HrpA-like RNA helicase